MLSRCLFVLMLVVAVGCSPGYYRSQADAQVYELVARTQEQELGEARPLSVEPPPPATRELEELTPLADEAELREALGGGASELEMPADQGGNPVRAPSEGTSGEPSVEVPSPAPSPGPVSGERAAGEGAGPEPAVAAPDKFALLEERGEAVPVPEEARVLGLADVLYMAFRHSRSYLSREETLYLEALALTLEQYRWSPQFRAALSGNVERSGDSPRFSLWDAGADVGVSLRLPDGGDLGASMSTDFAGDFGSRTTEEAESSWTVSLVQPLLRGFGRTIAQESLVQSERDVIYAVREFERFRRTFAVDTAEEFFGVLRQVDAVRNAYENYQSFKRNEKTAIRLADAGRRPKFEADQASQRTLSARNSWVQAVQSYEQALDRFKNTLGLPTELSIVLDSRELDRLSEKETLEPPAVALEDAIGIGIRNRLDLMVTRDQVADARRGVRVDEDQLRGDLDLTASASIGSKPTGEALDAQFHEGTYRLGVDYDLPVDRFSERNAYRRAIINLQRSLRSYSQAEDEVKLDVRGSYRTVQQNIATYRVDQLSLELAEERVKTVGLLIEAGRVETRNLLEALDDRVDAQNNLTRDLINLHIARLRLTQDLGLLRVDERGMWEEGALETEQVPERDYE